jgi:Fic family protein
MNEASPELWMLMGEAQSKCEHVAGIPLLPEVREDFLKIYLAKGTSATTAIEGNTMTEAQVRALLEDKLTLPPSQAYQQQEVENVIEGYRLIRDRMVEGRPYQLDVESLREYNRLILKDTPLNEDVIPGEIGTHAVVVGGYRGAPPEDCEYLLDRLCQWLNNVDGRFEAPYPHRRMAFEILKAVVAHLYLAWIHPFGDGNGRTARMVEFEILMNAGVPEVSAHLLSNHYNETRTEYYRQLQRSSRAQDVMGFITYALRGFVDALKLQIDVIKEQQLLVHWREYANAQFADQVSVTGDRKRRLVLDLSERSEPVKLDDIRYLSPKIAEMYAGKGSRTIDRDLKELVDMGLVEATPEGYRARREIVLAFRPRVRTG